MLSIVTAVKDIERLRQITTVTIESIGVRRVYRVKIESGRAPA
jgi:hypothetical protein